jgi:glycosyltransferase involved in cell wall biosynthesis
VPAFVFHCLATNDYSLGCLFSKTNARFSGCPQKLYAITVEVAVMTRFVRWFVPGWYAGFPVAGPVAGFPVAGCPVAGWRRCLGFVALMALMVLGTPAGWWHQTGYAQSSKVLSEAELLGALRLHEYAGQRWSRLLDYAFISPLVREQTSLWAEAKSLWATMKFYEYADVCLAPNPELVALVAQKTGKPTYLMQRGIDAEQFHPRHRTRPRLPSVVRLGFVGRLSTEKNVRFLAELEQQLLAQELTNIEFRIVGAGSERDWLAQTMKTATFAGVQHGERLAQEYADFDIFVFPSRTDTYGNVVLEAAASGVPCVVTGEGGPKFLVDPDESGVVAHDDAAFVAAVAELVRSAERRQSMGEAARARAQRASWDAVLDEVCLAYRAACPESHLISEF